MEDFNEAMFKTKVDNIFVKLYTCIMKGVPLRFAKVLLGKGNCVKMNTEGSFQIMSTVI